MFKKMLASFGIGAARVDTRLYEDTAVPGGTLQGEVTMRGGDITQQIDQVYLRLETVYRREINDRPTNQACVLAEYPIVDQFVLEPGQVRQVPFTIQLPLQTPLTIGHVPVFVRTGLAITAAADPHDTDQLRINPDAMQSRVFDALSRLGFQLRQVENEYNSRWRGPYPFVQEFEFRPSGAYASRLQELELVFVRQEGGLEVLLELDKRLRGLGRLFADLDLHERYARLQFTDDQLAQPNWAPWIDQAIRERIS